jgi:hypothetical protein
MTQTEAADRGPTDEVWRPAVVDAEIERALGWLIELIRVDAPRFDQVLPDDEPARSEVNVRAAATGQLLRAARLLEEALGCAQANANEALLMVVRTLLEIGFTTAYLIANGPGGMRRLHAEQERQRLKFAKPTLGDDHPEVAALQRRVNALGPGIGFGDMATSPQVGGQRVYDQWYRLLSQVSVHGGLASARRYLTVHGGQIRGRHRPDPPVPPQQALRVAGQCVVFLLNAVLPALSQPVPSELDAITALLGPAAAGPAETSSGSYQGTAP